MMLSHKIRLTLSPLVVCSLLATVFSACSGSDDHIPGSRPVEIIVSTGFGSASGVETRGDGSVSTEGILSGDPLPLSIVRTDQASEGDASYLPYSLTNTHGVGQAPRSGRLEKFNSDIRMNFDINEYYLSRSQNNHTKLIAWYPAVDNGSVWEVSDDGTHTATVSFTVDGETDILMSNLVEGSVDNPYSGTDNKMIFKHLLTRLKVRIYTTDATVSDIWGGVTGITFVGKSQICRVQLPDVESPGDTYPTDITFEGTDDLPIIPKDPLDNSPIAGYNNPDGALPIPVVDRYIEGDDTGLAGYAMVSPEDDALYLIVETQEKTSSPVKIIAPSEGGFAAGRSYTLALSVTTNTVIPTGVTIQDWELEEEGVSEIN